MKMKKRGQISDQFNWIFILIIGAIILTFFISIVNKQKASAEKTISINVILGVKDLLKAAVVKDKAVEQINMPKQKLQFYCLRSSCTLQGCYSGYRIKDQPVDVSSDQMVIFSPRDIEGRKLILYSYPFNFPYHVDNFLYVTSDVIRYILVDDGSDLANLVKNILPSNITLDLINYSQLNLVRDQNFDQVRYIFFNSEDVDNLLSSKSGKTNKNVTAVLLSYDEKPFGEVKYYYSDLDGVVENIGSAVFFDNATLLGSIFSQDEEIYTCNLAKSLGHYKRLTDIYGFKVLSLQNIYSDSNDCGIVNYDFSLFQEISSQVNRFIKTNNYDVIKNFYNNVKKIVSVNKYARDFSCPVIY